MPDPRRGNPGPPPSPPPLTPARFAEAYTAASRGLWCVAVGVLGSADAAEDVLQDAAVIALGKLDSFAPGTNFTAWMSQIVRNVALNTGRKRQRRRRRSDGGDALAGVPAPLPAAAAPTLPGGAVADDPRGFDAAVTDALATLDGIPRACLLLRTVLDLPYAEIAGFLDIPEGTAMSHVHRARRTLRARLRAQEVSP